MPSLEPLIQRYVNPFDPTTFKPGNFWQETYDSGQEVTSIHQGVLEGIDQTLDTISQDQKTRTLLLAGDSGSGKSYLLGRLKRRLNDKACFAYIGPWPDSEFIWRHVLRQTVDSLVQVPEGADESQLLRWLKGLPAFSERSLTKWMLGERTLFIRDLRAQFSTGIYNAKEFFGVLYDLTNPDLRPMAYDWLRGDDLDEADLQALSVQQSIDSEDAAQKMLGNFGRIAVSTQPMVLCFDNLDNIPLLANGKPDFQSLFSVNSTIHNEKLSNFLILISIITSTWRQNQKAIQPADIARINQKFLLKTINLDQAMALWASRLHPIQQQADPRPTSTIAPLTRDWLDFKFPGGKTLPRSALMLGQQLIQYFKENAHLPELASVNASTHKPTPAPQGSSNRRAHFGLVWQAELQKVTEHISRISQLSSPELIRRLLEALQALQIEGAKIPFLKRTKFSAYSLEYDSPIRTGLVWTEDRNMTTFYYLMRACEKSIQDTKIDRLYLLRSQKLGKSSTKGYKLFKQIFAYANYLHVQPDLPSVHILETYHRLVNAACGGELVVGPDVPDLKALQHMVREAKVLNDCSLLQELDLVPNAETEIETSPPASEKKAKPNSRRQATEKKANKRPSTKRARPKKTKAKAKSPKDIAQQHILNLMELQSLMGLQMLIAHTQTQISDLSESEILHTIHQLCKARKLQILDPKAQLQAQLICWVPPEGT